MVEKSAFALADNVTWQSLTGARSRAAAVESCSGKTSHTLPAAGALGKRKLDAMCRRALSEFAAAASGVWIRRKKAVGAHFKFMLFDGGKACQRAKFY